MTARMVAALLLLLGATEAWSATDLCATPGATSEAVLASFTARRAQCQGGDHDPAELTKLIRGHVSEQACAAPSRQALDKLKVELKLSAERLGAELTRLQSTVGASWQEPVRVLREQFDRGRRSFEPAADEVIPPVEEWTWTGNTRELFRRDNVFLFDLESSWFGECPRGSDPSTVAACAQTVKTAADVVRVVHLNRALLQCASEWRVKAVQSALTALDEQWDNYFFNARSQFIWELYVNQARFKGRDDTFASPPDDQVILLHPGVAMQYTGRNARSERTYDAVALVEVAGYNKITWGADAPAWLPPLGASVIAVYSPSTRGDRFGYGLMVHVKHRFSFGVTRRDAGPGSGKETAYLVSYDLMPRIDAASKRIAEFRGKGTPGSR